MSEGEVAGSLLESGGIADEGVADMLWRNAIRAGVTVNTSKVGPPRIASLKVLKEGPAEKAEQIARHSADPVVLDKAVRNSRIGVVRCALNNKNITQDALVVAFKRMAAKSHEELTTKAFSSMDASTAVSLITEAIDEDSFGFWSGRYSSLVDEAFFKFNLSLADVEKFLAALDAGIERAEEASSETFGDAGSDEILAWLEEFRARALTNAVASKFAHESVSLAALVGIGVTTDDFSYEGVTPFGAARVFLLQGRLSSAEEAEAFLTLFGDVACDPASTLQVAKAFEVSSSTRSYGPEAAKIRRAFNWPYEVSQPSEVASRVSDDAADVLIASETFFGALMALRNANLSTEALESMIDTWAVHIEGLWDEEARQLDAFSTEWVADGGYKRLTHLRYELFTVAKLSNAIRTYNDTFGEGELVSVAHLVKLAVATGPLLAWNTSHYADESRAAKALATTNPEAFSQLLAASGSMNLVEVLLQELDIKVGDAQVEVLCDLQANKHPALRFVAAHQSTPVAWRGTVRENWIGDTYNHTDADDGKYAPIAPMPSLRSPMAIYAWAHYVSGMDAGTKWSDRGRRVSFASRLVEIHDSITSVRGNPLAEREWVLAMDKTNRIGHLAAQGCRSAGVFWGSGLFHGIRSSYQHGTEYSKTVLVNSLKETIGDNVTLWERAISLLAAGYEGDLDQFERTMRLEAHLAKAA